MSTRSITSCHFMPCLLFSPLVLTSSEVQIFGNCDKYMEYRPWQFGEPRNKTPLPTIMNSRNIPHEIFQTSLGPGPQAAFAGPRDVWNISLGMFLSSIIVQYLTRRSRVKYCSIMDERNIPRAGKGHLRPRPKGCLEYFTRDVSRVHYRG